MAVWRCWRHTAPPATCPRRSVVWLLCLTSLRSLRRLTPWLSGAAGSDNGPLGSATISRAEERRVENLKNLGYNAIRTSHNPVSPAFLDACDRLGVLVMHEAFDCFENGKNTNDYHVYFDAWWRRDLATMVRRSQNHPSIVLWSIGMYHNQSQPLMTVSLVHHSIH